MVPVASVWWRASTRSRGGGWYFDGGGGGSLLLPTGGGSSTSDTIYTASTTTATSGSSAGESRPRDLHPFTEPVVEENAEEELYADVAKELAEDKAKKLEHIKGLVDEFRADDRRASERWLSELDAGWVLQLAGTHESSGSVVTSHGFQFLVETWILALRKIGESILTSLGGWNSQSQRQRQDEDEGESKQPSPSEFAELVQATVLKMLPFVDIVAAASYVHGCYSARSMVGAPAEVTRWADRAAWARWRVGRPAERLQVLIDMHDALSMASQHILSLQSQVAESADGAMRNPLSAEMTKLDEAIWGTITEIMDTIIAWLAWPCTNDDGSSVVHKVAYSIASCSKVLWANRRSVNRILHDAFLRGEYEPEDEDVIHVSDLVKDMISSLERKPFVTKPTRASSSSLDDSLRFLFLINNSYYLLQELRKIWLLDAHAPSEFLTLKVNGYIDGYLHESWAPVLKCLQDPTTPRCFNRYSSPLQKFVSKFQKTCAAQKAWKVPDPQMRRILREAIIDKVIPVFRDSWEENSISAPQITPREAEKMLGELFEG